MITIIYSTPIVDTFLFEKGSDEYAEKPFFCAIPLNTLVSIAYTIVGFYWLCRRRQRSANDNYSCAFGWVTITYSGMHSVLSYCYTATYFLCT